MLTQPGYSYYKGDIENVLRFMRNCLPAALDAKIYISEVLCTPKIVGDRLPGMVASMRHCQLFIIPLLINSHHNSGQLSHYTCLYIDITNKRYYYQDSLGSSSAYVQACQDIHDIMAAFFRVDLTVACVDLALYQQQFNGSDCGPAVLDNTWAVVKAFALGWPIEMWPRIISERLISQRVANYNAYYQHVRAQHHAWIEILKPSVQAALKGSLTSQLSEGDARLLQLRADVRTAILAEDRGDRVNYYSNRVDKFHIAMQCRYELSTIRAAMSQALQKEQRLKEYTDIFMGRIINALWGVAANVARGNEHVIQSICEQYLEQIRGLSDSSCALL